VEQEQNHGQFNVLPERHRVFGFVSELNKSKEVWFRELK